MSEKSSHMDEARMADISVVVPVFNRAGQLPAMLDSLERQTVIPREVILVDNASTDASLAVMEAWAKARNSEKWNVRILREPGRGAARARRKGEDAVTSRYVSFFDSDDRMHPDFIEKGMLTFSANPDADMAVWNISFIRPDGSRSRRRILKGKILRNHLVQGLLSTQSYAVRTDYLRECGGWNPDVGGWDDWELGLRLILNGGVISVTDEIRADVVVQENSITGLGYLHRHGDWENTISVMERMVRGEVADPELRGYLLRMLSYRRSILAAHYRREGEPEAARALLAEALSSTPLTMKERLLIRGAYLFTAMGFPGAGAIFPPLLTDMESRTRLKNLNLSLNPLSSESQQ